MNDDLHCHGTSRPPETQEERRARHLATLKRATELCLMAAERAATRAVMEDDPPQEPLDDLSPDEGEPQVMTLAAWEARPVSDASVDAALFPATLFPANGEPALRMPSAGSAAVLLVRLSAQIRQLVALEDRLAAGPADAAGEGAANDAPAAAAPARPFSWQDDDPRRAIILDSVDRAIADSDADAGERKLMRARATWELSRARDAMEADPADGKLAAVVAVIEQRNRFILDLPTPVDRAMATLSPYDWAKTGDGEATATGPP